jgi:hypothetical protein
MILLFSVSSHTRIGATAVLDRDDCRSVCILVSSSLMMLERYFSDPMPKHLERRPLLEVEVVNQVNVDQVYV